MFYYAWPTEESLVRWNWISFWFYFSANEDVVVVFFQDALVTIRQFRPACKYLIFVFTFSLYILDILSAFSNIFQSCVKRPHPSSFHFSDSFLNDN